MEKKWSRTEKLIGTEAINKLKNAKVLVFGIGGVGSYTIEALVRSGIGSIALVDKDVVDETNINRQLIATEVTIGKQKTEVMKERILTINPNCKVETFPIFYLPETADAINFQNYDYVVDAIDIITAKMDIIQRAKENEIPVISCMGTGNKLDPTQLEVSDLSKTSICPLAKVMRYELKKRGVIHAKVVYSKERSPHTDIVGSVPFVPSVAGLIIAGEVIKDLIKKESKD